MAEITCEITEPIAVLSTNEKSGWTKEVNMASWNKNSPKLDVRDWSPGHGRKGKGVTKQIVCSIIERIDKHFFDWRRDRWQRT